jgi:hypothetical protein
MKPPHENVIIPVSDLITELRSKLADFGISPAGFEEIVRQCFDIYMDWRGDDEHVRLVPFFNRIVIPAMTGEQHQTVYDAVQYHVHVFAKALFSRLMEHGFFPKSHTTMNMDYAFSQFVDNDVMLQHFAF